MSRARTAYIGLGSNLGDRRKQIDEAVRALGEADGVRVVCVSDLVDTEPVGGPANQPVFLNGVLEVCTTLEPRDLLMLLHSIEAKSGRDREREERNGPRTLDLDLLTLGDEEMREADLVLPHPRLEEREFVLEPFAMIAPNRILAHSKQTVTERLNELRQAHVQELR